MRSNIRCDTCMHAVMCNGRYTTLSRAGQPARRWQIISQPSFVVRVLCRRRIGQGGAKSSKASRAGQAQQARMCMWDIRGRQRRSHRQQICRNTLEDVQTHPRSFGCKHGGRISHPRHTQIMHRSHVACIAPQRPVQTQTRRRVCRQHAHDVVPQMNWARTGRRRMLTRKQHMLHTAPASFHGRASTHGTVDVVLTPNTGAHTIFETPIPAQSGRAR